MKRIIATKIPRRRYVKASEYEDGPTGYQLQLAAELIVDHINGRLEEHDLPAVKFKGSNLVENYNDGYEASYTATLVDPKGTKLPIVLEFRRNGSNWFDTAEMYDLTDELDEFFYDYCENAKISI